MKKILLALAVFLLGISAYGADSDPAAWFDFKTPGLKPLLVSAEVSMEGLAYTFATPTAVDSSGNFYYCSAEGNPNGFLWIIKKVDIRTGKVSEVCRLNLSNRQYSYIRSINFSPGGELYVWLSLGKSEIKEWNAALVKITGFGKR